MGRARVLTLRFDPARSRPLTTARCRSSSRPGRCSRSATTSSSATRCRTWRFSLDVVEDLVEARYSRDRRAILARANLRLEKLRVLLRLCHALGYFPHARSAVESLVMTLQDLTPREPQAQLFFRIVDEQADNMRALIGDLLDTARIEAGALSVAAEAATTIENL